MAIFMMFFVCLAFSFTASFSLHRESSLNEEAPEAPDQNYRWRRQAVGTAMDYSLTDNKVGKPEFGGQFHGGQFKDFKNFGARVGTGAGVKVYDTGSHSVGVGLGASTNVGLQGGRPTVGRPELGVGVGYQRGRFGTSVGVGRDFTKNGSGNSFGANFRYRFKRMAPGGVVVEQ